MNRPYCVLAVALALASCNRNAIYSHYEHIRLEGWAKADTIWFVAGPIAEEGTYHERLELRTGSTYPYTALTLIVSQKTTGSPYARTDTLTTQMMDDEGNAKAKGIDHYIYNIALPDVALAEGDSLCISVRHNMRRDPLPGLSDVGVTLFK